LTVDGGLPNTVAQLAEYNRGKVDDMLQWTAPMEKAFNKLHGRFNQIVYIYPVGSLEQFVQQSRGAQNLVAKLFPDFTIVASGYSGVGDGVSIHASMAQQSVTKQVVLNEPVLNEHQTDEQYDEPGVDSDCDSESDTDDEGSSDEDDDDGMAYGIETTEIAPGSQIGPVTQVEIVSAGKLLWSRRKWVTYETPSSSTPALARKEANLLAYAKEKLLALTDAGSGQFTTSNTLSDRMCKIGVSIALSAEDLPLPILPQGWARRPPHGRMYGAKYMAEYAV
jgi:hypothetical protein